MSLRLQTGSGTPVSLSAFTSVLVKTKAHGEAILPSLPTSTESERSCEDQLWKVFSEKLLRAISDSSPLPMSETFTFWDSRASARPSRARQRRIHGAGPSYAARQAFA